ncbi:N-acetylglucosamine-6-phosphate deacetylase [Tepidanaerobacter acetatoxydans Re1]|jgi:N-acetylglucosamine-6-phosphate deacetylase|uniref:N-acetylglucosamine-6-phosphate deacetylase n=1 Tax=Tepidanaerobacter acetatoxydans (strain DSM 21804 / JCM 16047 / Re1) TaxID=1209989 RepID=F4LUU8_TEPAE|nr:MULTISPECIES: N-acetylglucosamine-6-phosphate deacetylase [Tepidanaerobacter]AEE90666.1 N-acetylglucosamine-6-phosphate deacetylase [Tepidanaerobacter acetatoxydans Re1]CCP25197.1 N-acetylglucosamine-6-phosphate deacetylase [Tepidanaerobacter acetatoxydans Re1]
MSLFIKSANIITPYEILYGFELAVEGTKIKHIAPAGTLEEGGFDEIIDAKGNYLSPGFIDIHTHANSGHDTMDATFEALDAMARFHSKNGVTGFLATTMTASTADTKKAIKNVSDYMVQQKHGTLDISNNPQAEVLGLYLEGPYFSLAKKGAQSPEYLKNPDIDELVDLIKLSGNSIKVVALAPELPYAMEAVSFLHSQGITVSAGHSDASFEIAKNAFDHGATQVTHIFNGMKSFTHREPGIAGAALTDERVYCEMICDGIHLHPGAMRLVVNAKGKDKVILISDSMMAAGLQDGEYTLGGQKVIVKDRQARLIDGTLAGSTLTLNQAVYNMVKMVGVPLQDAVRMASLNPARAIGIDRYKGSIEIGKDADLIIFDEELNILNVVKAY